MSTMKPITKPWMLLRASAAFVKLVRDTSKLDEVFAILDTLEEHGAAEELTKQFTEAPEHDAVFSARPRVYPVDAAALARLPEGTLGRTFIDQMRMRQLNPDDIKLRPDGGTRAGYVFRHLRETHDVWHTATGFDVDVAGELGLQAFYLAQFTSQLALVLLAVGLLNTAIFELSDRDARMTAIADGWRLGRAARPLFGFDWAAHWSTPLSEVRSKLQIGSLTNAANTRAALGVAA